MSNLSMVVEFSSLHRSRVGETLDVKLCELCGFPFLRKTPSSARVGAKYGPCCAAALRKLETHAIIRGSNSRIAALSRDGAPITNAIHPPESASPFDPERGIWGLPEADEALSLADEADAVVLRVPKANRAKRLADHSARAGRPLANPSDHVGPVRRVGRKPRKLNIGLPKRQARGCVGKIKFKTLELAKDALTSLKRTASAERKNTLVVYPCEFCKQYHLGHQRNRKRVTK